MTYVVLLRGVNVGGHGIVPMAQLRDMFARLGFTAVRTYINSGNIIFQTDDSNRVGLEKRIESGLAAQLGWPLKVFLRTAEQIQQLAASLPKTWVNDQTMKCDVMFLDETLDNPAILKRLPWNPAIEELIYLPGAAVWRIDRSRVSGSRMFKLVGTDLIQHMTARNPNTVRKLCALL